MSTDNRKTDKSSRTDKQDEKIADLPAEQSERDAQQVKGGMRKNTRPD